MYRFNRILAPLAIAALMTFSACSGDADVDIDADSVDIDNDNDTTVVMPMDTTTNMMDTAGSAIAGETIQKMVETQLALSPGFQDVDVESETEGVIILNGTVASAEEKTRAETEAKAVAGVTSVTNNLTVK